MTSDPRNMNLNLFVPRKQIFIKRGALQIADSRYLFYLDKRPKKPTKNMDMASTDRPLIILTESMVDLQPEIASKWSYRVIIPK